MKIKYLKVLLGLLSISFIVASFNTYTLAGKFIDMKTGKVIATGSDISGTLEGQGITTNDEDIATYQAALNASRSGTSSNSFQLDDLGISIDIPSDYNIAFTRDVDENDPNLAKAGTTKKDLMEMFESRNIYLDAMETDFSSEIVVTMVSSSTTDFNLYSDSELCDIITSSESEFSDAGITVEDYEIYQHSQAKFIKFHITQMNNGNVAYGVQYFTTYNNKAINITLHSYSGKITDNQEALIKASVDSVYFEADPVVTGTDAFIYYDDDTGVSFTVPANWVEVSNLEEGDSIYKIFSSNIESDICILYGSSDFWGNLSSSEKSGQSRSDYNNSIFSNEEMAKMLGIPEESISRETYAGKEYFAFSITNPTTVSGFDVSVPTTYLMRFDNGFGYTFQFAGADSSNSHYKDFEALLNSVEYPTENSSTNDVTDGNNSAANEGTQSESENTFSVPNLIISILVTIAIYSVPIFIYRFAIVKEPVEHKKAKKVTIIYGAVAFVIMSILIILLNGSWPASGAIILWSWVNYKVLTSGKKTGSVVETDNCNDGGAIKTNDNLQVEENLPTSHTDVKLLEPKHFCPYCGAKLESESKFCHICGAKIEGDL